MMSMKARTARDWYRAGSATQRSLRVKGIPSTSMACSWPAFTSCSIASLETKATPRLQATALLMASTEFTSCESTASHHAATMATSLLFGRTHTGCKVRNITGLQLNGYHKSLFSCLSIGSGLMDKRLNGKALMSLHNDSAVVCLDRVLTRTTCKDCHWM